MSRKGKKVVGTWWRHQMETFSALLANCAGNSPVPGEFLAQRPVTRRFDVFFDLRLNKRLSKQSWVWWFETRLSRPLRRHRNEFLLVHHPNVHLTNYGSMAEPKTNRCGGWGWSWGGGWGWLGDLNTKIKPFHECRCIPTPKHTVLILI